MNEKKHADALIKSLPTSTPKAIRQAIKIARLRLEAALVTGRPTAAIITEIEQRVDQALTIEKKNSGWRIEHNRPFQPRRNPNQPNRHQLRPLRRTKPSPCPRN